MREKTEGNSRTKIYGWIKNDLLIYSEAYFTRMEYENIYVPLKGELDKVSGWGNLVCTYLKKSPEMLRIAQGLLLTGPDGCGKHSAAWHGVRYLSDPDRWMAQLDEDDTASPFVYVDIRASELDYLCDSNTSPEECIQILFEYFLAEKKQNLCLVVEYPEDCSMEKRLTECLGDCMIRYRLSEETAVPFLIVLSRDPSGMSPVLRRQLWQCRVQMPDETMRKRFWECTLEKGGESQDWHTWQLGYPEEKITAELLTELTEGMTYRGMRELYDCLCCAVQAQDQTAAENLLREEFRRVHPEINELEHMEKQLSEKEILFEKIGRLLDWIPEFASQLFEAVGENAERHSEILKNLPEHRKTTADADEYAYSETSQDVQVPAQNVQSEINDELRGVLKNTGNIANDMSELTSLYDAVDKKKIVEKHAKDTVGELLAF